MEDFEKDFCLSVICGEHYSPLGTKLTEEFLCELRGAYEKILREDLWRPRHWFDLLQNWILVEFTEESAVFKYYETEEDVLVDNGALVEIDWFWWKIFRIESGRTGCLAWRTVGSLNPDLEIEKALRNRKPSCY